MQCNIDSRGRTVRIVVGAVVEGTGWALLALRWTGILEGDWPWYVGGAAVLGGLFMIVEGVAGWCAVRAMGFRTPI